MQGNRNPFAEPSADAGIDLQWHRKDGDVLTATFEAFETLDLVALAAQDPRPAEFVVEKLFARGEFSLLTGSGGDGKTLFALHIAVAMAAQLTDVLGLTITPGPVILYTAEDSVRELHWRLDAICRRLGVNLEGLAGRLHIVTWRGEPDGHFGVFAADGTFSPSPAFQRLRALVTSTCSAMVFVDNLAHVFTGNENDRMQVTKAMAPVNGAAEETECAWVILAHPPKAGDSYSGSTAWRAVCRCHVNLSRDEEGDRDVRVVTVEKSNYGPAGEATRFRWMDHSFVCDADLPVGVAAEIAAVSRANAANDKFLECLAKMTEQGRNVTHSKAGNFAPRLFAKLPIAKGYNEAELEAAMERLFTLGTIVADAKVGTYSNRQAKLGIALADTAPPKGAQNPAQNPAQHGCQDRTKPPSAKGAQDLHTTPPIPYGDNGGDHDGPPSSPGEGDARDGVPNFDD